MAAWNPYDQNASSPFFDSYWIFGVEKGFDVVIGNPPYVRADSPAIARQREIILQSGQYETLWEKWDLMIPFFEKGLKILNTGGFLMFISSNAVTTSKYAEKLQAWIIEKHFVRSVDYFENIKVFDAGVVPVVISIQANMKDASKMTRKIYRKDTFDNAEIVMVKNDCANLQSTIFRKSFSDMFNPVIASDKLGDICYISYGLRPNSDEKTAKGEFAKDDLISDTKDKIHCKEYVEGKNIGAYRIGKIRYLEFYTNRVPSKLVRPTFENLFTGEKILRGRVTKGTFDNTGIVCNDSIIVFKRFCDLNGIEERSISVSISKNNFEEHGSKTTAKVKKRRTELEKLSKAYSLKYILALINSSYAMAYLNNYRRHRLENYFYPDDFRKFPIAKIPLAKQKAFIDLADKILAAKAADPKADTSRFERQVDSLVYRLYNLSWDEVRVIEPGFSMSKAEYEGMGYDKR
jgi:adenine-specific DNA-methyltransferase